uniref:Odorant receptor n=1 Tax=Locusta migratoria TaxID=7004 RepID=A0A0M3SBP5_LOCMI|nr:odorant receptor 11 [Locusta migratoria]
MGNKVRVYLNEGNLPREHGSSLGEGGRGLKLKGGMGGEGDLLEDMGTLEGIDVLENSGHKADYMLDGGRGSEGVAGVQRRVAEMDGDGRSSGSVHLRWCCRQVERDFAEFLSPEDVPLLRASGRRLRRVVRAYLWFGAAGCMWWLLYPVACFGLTVQGVPYQMLLPYDVARPAVFAANWLFCTLPTLHVAVMTMASDSYSVSLMVQLRLQLQVLGKNLVALARGAEANHQKKCVKHGPSAEGLVRRSQLEDAIRQNIRHHQTIIRNTELLEKSMGAILLAQCLSIGATVCIQLYQIAVHAQGLVDAGKFGCYLFIMLAQLFVYCWFGDDFITESLKVSTAAYDAVTSLEGSSCSTKRSLVLMMLRAQRPLRITAAGFFPLSRESFVAVVNMSYSFFAILRNFKDEMNS